MLRIDTINSNLTAFQAHPTSIKLAAQKNARKLVASEVEQLLNTRTMTGVKSQVIDDVGLFMAKEASKEAAKKYSATSTKLAEQKATKLSTKA